VKRRAGIVGLVVVLMGALGVNVVAYMQARSMTHFSSSGARTEGPERLGSLAAVGVVLSGVNIPRPESARTPADFDLSFDTIALPTRDGMTLEAWRVPVDDQKPLILVFHGYAASKATMLPPARALHELGYSTLLFDFYGSGGSSGNDTSLGYLEARDVAVALEYVRQQWPGRKVVLYGFSMGSAAILRAIAVEGAQPDAIVLEATFDGLLSTVRNRFRSMGLPGTPFAELLLFWGGVQWSFDPFDHNPVDYARSVRCPTLILHGEADARVTSDQANRVAQAIGKHADFVSYPGVPHMLIVAARPTQWKHDIARFLARL
jgi:alpha-beta hydrolase superfamily lysophospholipase